MALGTLENETKKKVYLSISRGKIVHYRSEGGVDYFKNVTGTLEDVYKKERVFNGQRVPFWYLDIRDKDELYSLSLPFVSGTFKSIILALANCEELCKETSIVIEPYEKNNYTKVVVYANGNKLDWVTKELPELREVKVNGNVYTDDTERMAFISSLADKVKSKLMESDVSVLSELK